jgi:RNA polymerase sigma-70 factor (ECF subfamily)
MADERQQKRADRYLVDRIRAGDEEAWNQLIARYSGRLLAFARRKLASPDDAEDVVQETFIGFVQSLPTYDQSRSLETYLFAILRYQLIRAYRKAPKAKGIGFDPLDDSSTEGELPAAGQTPSGYLRRKELLDQQGQRLADALRQLTREFRDRNRLEDLMVIELSFFVGMRNRDIARTLDRAETHVGSVKHRAIQRVRELVGGASELASELNVSAVWRSHRLSCLKRSTLGAYQLGVLEEPWLAFCRFHLETVRCELCLANAEDLAAEAAESDSTPFRKKIFASSIGFLSQTRQDR